MIADDEIVTCVFECLLAEQFVGASGHSFVPVGETEHARPEQSGAHHEGGAALQQRDDGAESFRMQAEADHGVTREDGEAPEKGQSNKTSH